MDFMTYLAIIFTSLVVCFLIVRFAKYSMAVIMTLIAGIIIGILLIPINLKFGIALATWCFCLIILFWILFAAAGFISLVVVTPIMLLLGAIGLVKND